MDANSSSQPFVSLYPVNLTAQAPAEFLDGKHTVFGRVIEHGNDMLVLRKIENVPTGPNNRPKLAVGAPWLS